MNTAFGSTGIDTAKLTSAAATGLGTLAAISATTGGLGTILSGIEGGALLGNAAIGAGLGATGIQTIEALGGTGSGSGGLGGGSSQGLDKVVHIYVIQKELSDSQDKFNPVMDMFRLMVFSCNLILHILQKKTWLIN